MRLLCIAVRHYRVLRDVKIELAPGLTLIGAPNETGKSTLIEAVHRGLFLRARVTGRQRDAMLSQGRADHPEVEVSFVSGGSTWHVVKKFAGQSGQCTLTQEGGTTWRGDEAEGRLAEVLGVTAASGRAVSEQWAHLWVWQGDSFQDPTDKANDQKASLLSRLEQAEGGVASVMQSALDSALAVRFQQQHDELFQKNGDPRAQSTLGRAAEESSRAVEAAAAARARCEALAHSAASLMAARESLQRAAADEAVVGPQALQTEAALARVTALRAVEARQAMEAEVVRVARDRLRDAEAQITEFAATRRALDEALAPEEQVAGTLAREEEQCLARLEAAESERAAAAAARTAAQHAHDVAAARLAVLEKSAESTRWQDASRLVESLRAEDRRVTLELAALPGVDAAGLKSLAALEKSRDEAAATLRGMAAGVQVVAADQPVHLEGVPLQTGEERVLTTAAELAIGPGVRVRLTPGGGAGLEVALRRQSELDESLRSSLATLGLPSVIAAAETFERRRQLEAERLGLRKRLADSGAEALPARVAAAAEALAVAEATLARHHAAAPSGEAMDPRPGDGVAAQEQCRVAAAALSAALAHELAATSARTAVDQALASVRRRRAEQSAALTERRTELERARARHDFLVSTHGEASTRLTALASAVDICALAEAALHTTRAELAALQPEALEADHARLRRALDDIDRRRREAETAQAIARSELTRDGGDDPHELLAQSLAREQAAAETMAHARRDAEAVRLLHRLFAEEQRDLAARLTRPLADKINAYLQCIFGPGAEAVLTFEDQAFGSLALVRPDQFAGAVPFEALSGGAREQVAAAMRLAMAEVLAAGHDGCLPLVFDDAFAYADPERVQSLQRMLDLAARRGLQLIVLTCTPGDYAGLGARVVALKPA